MRKLSDISVKNKTVALRADLNVPVKEGIILDDARIEAVIPTVKYLLIQNCKIILISHFGRPKAGTFDPEASLQPIAIRIGEMLNHKVDFISAIEDVKFKNKISLLENTRFLIGELENNEELSITLDLWLKFMFSMLLEHLTESKLQRLALFIKPMFHVLDCCSKLKLKH
jgi:phosphoglycerate kinase